MLLPLPHPQQFQGSALLHTVLKALLHLQGAEYTAALVEKDGNFITGKGPGAALEFAFAIVEKYCGIQMVNELKKGMMIHA